MKKIILNSTCVIGKPGQTETIEMGKPISLSNDEADDKVKRGLAVYAKDKKAAASKPLKVVSEKTESEKDETTININRATADQISKHIKGVGPEIAKAIVALTEKAPFESEEDLAGVPGIGNELVADMLPLIRFNDE